MINCPFTILIDTGESRPFTFQDIKSDANQNLRPFAVRTKRACLGRHPDSLGDYTIDGAFGFVAVNQLCHVNSFQGTAPVYCCRRAAGSVGLLRPAGVRVVLASVPASPGAWPRGEGV